MRKFIVNAVSFNMFSHLESRRVVLSWRELGEREFCEEIKTAYSYIGHQATADILSTICGFAIPVIRESLRVYPSDVLYLIQVTERLPEGRVLSKEEILVMLGLGKVKLYEIRIEA